MQNRLLRFILTDDDLRDYVCEWGLNRTRDDESAPQPVLEKNEHYAKVEAEVLSLWEDS